MAQLLHLAKVSGPDDQTWRNIAKVVFVGVGCVAGVAAIYKAYTYVKHRPAKYAITGEKPPEGPIITDVTLDPLVAALALKEEGNKLYKAKKFQEAKELYTQAIDKCPFDDDKNLAIFHQNRAAANDALNLSKAVVDDCDAAIQRDGKYQKAFARRARAHCKLGNLELALSDAARGYYLQDKKTDAVSDLFHEVINRRGRELAEHHMKTRDPVPIGEECIRAYYSNFSNDPVYRNLETLSQSGGDGVRSPFAEACAKFLARNYNEVVPLLSNELDDPNSPNIHESLVFRATMLTLAGCADRAILDYDRLLDMENVNTRLKSTALLRKGLILIAKMESNEGLACMAKAAEIDPTNSDVFHHKGQIALLMQELDQSLADTSKAISLQEPGSENANTLLQKYMCDLQLAQVNQNGMELQSILRKMEKMCTNHPKEAECWCLFAQALIFFNQFTEAEDVYVKALAQCKDNPRIYIQRAAMTLAWKKDTEKALEYLEKAKTSDPYCEAVYENIGLLYLNQGKLEQAMQSFQEYIKYSRTILDCQNGFSLVESIKAQISFREEFNQPVGNIFNVMSPGGIPITPLT